MARKENGYRLAPCGDGEDGGRAGELSGGPVMRCRVTSLRGGSGEANAPSVPDPGTRGRAASSAAPIAADLKDLRVDQR